MSTPHRRTLGTGPRESKVELWISGPRLLPAERAEREQLLADEDEDQAVQMLRGRRTLGSGPDRSGS